MSMKITSASRPSLLLTFSVVWLVLDCQTTSANVTTLQSPMPLARRLKKSSE